MCAISVSKSTLSLWLKIIPLNKEAKERLYTKRIEILSKVSVPKGTDMRHRVFGWIKASLSDIEPKVEIAQKEWKSLKEIKRPVNLSR